MEAPAGKRLLDWPSIPLRARELLEKGPNGLIPYRYIVSE
jgi:hypothetical protein